MKPVRRMIKDEVTVITDGVTVMVQHQRYPPHVAGWSPHGWHVDSMAGRVARSSKHTDDASWQHFRQAVYDLWNVRVPDGYRPDDRPAVGLWLPAFALSCAAAVLTRLAGWW